MPAGAQLVGVLPMRAAMPYAASAVPAAQPQTSTAGAGGGATTAVAPAAAAGYGVRVAYQGPARAAAPAPTTAPAAPAAAAIAPAAPVAAPSVTASADGAQTESQLPAALRTYVMRVFQRSMSLPSASKERVERQLAYVPFSRALTLRVAADALTSVCRPQSTDSRGHGSQ